MVEVTKEHLAFFDTMMREEPIHPDLVPYLQDGVLGQMVHHRLVIQTLFGDTQHCGMLNAHYQTKLEAVERAANEGNWSRFVFLHERPYRLDALIEAYTEGLNDHPKAYWPLVAQIWTDSENIYQWLDEWREVWDSDTPDRHLVMSEDERAVLAALPDVIPVWRGINHEGNRDGMSWTIDKDRAHWFATRFDTKGRGKVFAATVAKCDVLGYFDGRNENEIVVLPEALDGIKEVK